MWLEEVASNLQVMEYEGDEMRNFLLENVTLSGSVSSWCQALLLRSMVWAGVEI